MVENILYQTTATQKAIKKQIDKVNDRASKTSDYKKQQCKSRIERALQKMNKNDLVKIVEQLTLKVIVKLWPKYNNGFYLNKEQIEFLRENLRQINTFNKILFLGSYGLGKIALACFLEMYSRKSYNKCAAWLIACIINKHEKYVYDLLNKLTDANVVDESTNERGHKTYKLITKNKDLKYWLIFGGKFIKEFMKLCSKLLYPLNLEKWKNKKLAEKGLEDDGFNFI